MSKHKNISHAVFNRMLHYTETIFLWLTVLYFLFQFISVGLILYAITMTQQFSYLDTFISETNQTFRDVAGVVIVKFLVENIFKYNDFGRKKKDTSTNVEPVPDDTINEEAQG